MTSKQKTEKVKKPEKSSRRTPLRKAAAEANAKNAAPSPLNTKGLKAELIENQNLRAEQHSNKKLDLQRRAVCSCLQFKQDVQCLTFLTEHVNLQKKAMHSHYRLNLYQI